MTNQRIRHGGDIDNAVNLYGGDAREWLDLSTGISPWQYPIPQIDNAIWRRLPATQTALLNAASQYYNCNSSDIIATPGSQLAIRLIPTLIKSKQTIAVPLIGYQEHANSWSMAGHSLIRYQSYNELTKLVNLKAIDSAVVINPNNPTAEVINPDKLMRLSDDLRGILLVDEAFADIDKSISTCNVTMSSSRNIVTLKSIGKFFGLAGARVGFVVSRHPIINKLEQLFSPWSISGPSQAIATAALSDTDWQFKQSKRLTEHAKIQRAAIESINSKSINCESTNHESVGFTLRDHGLFFTIFSDIETISTLHTQLAQQKIWSRQGDPFLNEDLLPSNVELNWLRLSLAGDDFATLSKALKSVEI